MAKKAKKEEVRSQNSEVKEDLNSPSSVVGGQEEETKEQGPETRDESPTAEVYVVTLAVIHEKGRMYGTGEEVELSTERAAVRLKDGSVRRIAECRSENAEVKK